ncbi:MAG: hypothetical protein JWL77_2954 [Chthonomonadaceae bacterium]|nr:hypothetical protein [Chthonomonadaceae bacterium]
MAGRCNSLRFLLIGMGGLWCAFGLTGCSVISNLSDDSDSPAHSTSKHVVSDRSVTVSETFQKTYAALKVKTLRVRDEMGAIEIKPADESKDEIRIEATKTLEGRSLSETDLKKLLSKVRIVAHLEGDALVVEADHETDGFPDNVDATVAFVISVPKRLALDLRTDNSPITATGADGGVTLRTSNGAIELSQLGGAVDAETSNAPISLKEAQAQTTLKLVTSNGRIDCEEIHAASPALDVTLETVNAPVAYAGDATIATLHSSNGEVTYEPTTFTLVKADIQTDNAPITVTMPMTLSATIDAQTSNGSVTLEGISDPGDLNSDSERSARRIVLNSGKAAITVRTSNGSIALESR